MHEARKQYGSAAFRRIIHAFTPPASVCPVSLMAQAHEKDENFGYSKEWGIARPQRAHQTEKGTGELESQGSVTSTVMDNQ